MATGWQHSSNQQAGEEPARLRTVAYVRCYLIMPSAHTLRCFFLGTGLSAVIYMMLVTHVWYSAVGTHTCLFPICFP